MVSWAYGLDKSALKNGILKLPDQFFTCPKCHRKRGMREWVDLRTNAGCLECLKELSWSQMWRRGGASVRYWIAKRKGKR